MKKTLHQHLRGWLRFVQYVGRRFISDNHTFRAGSLAFTTLLSLVPLMSVSFSLLSVFPVFRRFSQLVENFIFDNFVASSGKVVQTYLQEFVEKAQHLSAVGLIFLLITAVLLMFTIEGAMNDIWRVRKRRKGVSAFLMYWAVLTLMPVTMGASITISSYFASLPLFSSTADTIGFSSQSILAWLPVFLAFVTFTLLYVAIPNTKVRLSHGMFGAFVAVLLFDVAKKGFGMYLKQFDTYELLYGAFAAIPIFFLWVYLVWLIVLFGGEVAYACSANYDRRLGKKIDGFTQAFRWISHLWEAQQSGGSWSLRSLIDLDPYNYQVPPDEQLNYLLKAKLIKPTANGNFILSRDLAAISLGELNRLLPWQLPPADSLKGAANSPEMRLKSVLEQLEKASKTTLNTSVAAILRG